MMYKQKKKKWVGDWLLVILVVIIVGLCVWLCKWIVTDYINRSHVLNRNYFCFVAGDESKCDYYQAKVSEVSYD